MGSLGTDWQQRALLQFWRQDPRPLALIQRPRARRAPQTPLWAWPTCVTRQVRAPRGPSALGCKVEK